MSQGRSDIGWMARHHRSHPSRSWSAIKRSRRANPRIHDSRANHGRRICGPPYDQLALGARDVLTRCSRLAWGPAWIHEKRREPSDDRNDLVFTSSLDAPDTDGRSDRSRGPSSQGLGLASPSAPRRAAEIGDTRGAFHRLTTNVHDSGLTPAVASPARHCPQFVTSLWRVHGAFSTLARSGSLDGPPVSESAVSASNRVEPKPNPIRAAMVAHPTPADHRP